LVAPNSSTAASGGVEVVDDDVKVHLLRDLLSRPRRRRVVLHLLERDALTVISADVGPVIGNVYLPIQKRAVERGECTWIGIVDHDARESCDSHGGTVRAIPDDSRPDETHKRQYFPNGHIAMDLRVSTSFLVGQHPLHRKDQRSREHL
jgi:hypothetical protein